MDALEFIGFCIAVLALGVLFLIAAAAGTVGTAIAVTALIALVMLVFTAGWKCRGYENRKLPMDDQE